MTTDAELLAFRDQMGEWAKGKSDEELAQPKRFADSVVAMAIQQT